MSERVYILWDRNLWASDCWTILGVYKYKSIAEERVNELLSKYRTSEKVGFEYRITENVVIAD